MLFKISPEILRDYPGINIGVIVARDISNSSESQDVKELLLHQQQQLAKTFTLASLVSHPFIVAWRNAYKKFGASGQEYRSSVESLAQRVLKSKPIKSVNTVVDLYNALSLRYLLPMGGYDLDSITGDIKLVYASADEVPVMVLGQTYQERPIKGEVIYKDNESALCRRWNWRDVQRVKLDQNTKNGLLIVEALAPVDQATLETALYDLSHLIEQYCGGLAYCGFLNEDHPQIELKKVPRAVKKGSYEVIPQDTYQSKHEPDHVEHQEHHEYEYEVRLEKVKRLRAMGIDPWPEAKAVDNTCAQIIGDFQESNGERQYTIAGRIMAIRLHGKTAFAHIQDSSARLQIYLRQDSIGVKDFTLFKDFIDIGDIVWCEGTSFKTKTGEVTLKVKILVLLSKCLHPLPEKFHGLTHVETKYRQRYLDLMTNPETRERFIKRIKVVSSVRKYLDDNGYLEVETPMLHPIAGGAAAKPFITHYNALNSDFYLRIAPELYLKRLLIGGFDRVYEINRNFRNEGISTRHNPEFTMLEFYTAYKDYHFSMTFVEDMLRTVAQQVAGTLQLTYMDYMLNLEVPFERINPKDAVIKYGSLLQEDLSEDTIDVTLKRKGVHLKNPKVSLGEKIFALFEELAESQLIQPTFVIDYPIELSPLAKQDPHNPEIAPRYELFIAGMEISNSYNELNDPFEQAKRFHEQMEAYAAGNVEAHQFDADYIRALEYGLPPAVGVGIGIDRLVMLITNTPSIKEVILFPALKKKEG
jgi:lysyl-tRNA synthetase, class II